MFLLHNHGGVFTGLKNKDRFKRVVGNYALIWLNPETNAYDEGAIELAPECVRFFSVEYGKKIKAANGNGHTQ